MKHYSWLINPVNGDYEIANGSPIVDDSLQFPAYVRLKVQRGKWLYAPNAEYGSDLGLIQKQTKRTPALIENVSLRALQPIIDDGRAEDIVVVQTGNARFGEEMQVTILDKNQQSQTLTLNPLGM